jgi:hypothetical protein
MREYPQFTVFAGPMASGKTTALHNLIGEFEATNTPFAVYKPRLEIRNNGLQPRGISENDARQCEVVDSLNKIDSGALSLKGISRILLEEFMMFGYNNDRSPSDVNFAELLQNWALNEITHVYAAGLDLAASGNTFPLFKQAHEIGAKVVLFESKCEYPSEDGGPTCRKAARNTQIYSKSEGKAYSRSSLPDLLPEGDDPDRGYRAVCMSHFLLSDKLTIKFN